MLSKRTPGRILRSGTRAPLFRRLLLKREFDIAVGYIRSVVFRLLPRNVDPPRDARAFDSTTQGLRLEVAARTIGRKPGYSALRRLERLHQVLVAHADRRPHPRHHVLLVRPIGGDAAALGDPVVSLVRAR